MINIHSRSQTAVSETGMSNSLLSKMPKMSPRERWLVSLLPAILIIILSTGMPGVSKELASAEKRLTEASSATARERRSRELGQLVNQIQQSQQALQALATQQAELQSLLDLLQSPVIAREQTLAGALDALTDRLAAYDIQVLAITQANTGSSRRDWQISIAATWQNMRDTLLDADTFPPGLALSSLQMTPSRLALPQRRWELKVSDLGARI